MFSGFPHDTEMGVVEDPCKGDTKQSFIFCVISPSFTNMFEVCECGLVGPKDCGEFNFSLQVDKGVFSSDDDFCEVTELF